MHNVFIDANVLLSFFAYTSDDLTQLEKLIAELKAGNLRLLITEQVLDEFRRNRESKIAQTLADFSSKAGIDQFPRMLQQHKEFDALSTAAEEYKKRKAAILKTIQEDIKNKTLPADKIIDEIVMATQIIPTTPDVVEAARLRMSLRRPPGKDGSLGDAINWELLLQNCPKPSDLHFVSNDKDFLSPLVAGVFNQYLSDEWKAHCDGQVSLFPNIRDLFKKIAPAIKLSTAANTASLGFTTYAPSVTVSTPPLPLVAAEQLENRVTALIESHNYQQTHRTIAKLQNVAELSPDQVARLYRAAVENQQINSISEDEDVLEFFQKLYKTFPDLLEDDIKDPFLAQYN